MPERNLRGTRCAIRRTPSTRKRTITRVLLRLEVNVARAFLGSLEDDRVHQPHHRAVGDPVFGFEVVCLLVDRDEVVVEHRAESLVGPREPANLEQDVFFGGDRELDCISCGEAELVDRVDVLRIGDRDREDFVLEGERDRADAFEHLQRDLLGRFGIDPDHREVDERHPEARRELAGRGDVRRSRRSAGPFVRRRGVGIGAFSVDRHLSTYRRRQAVP